MTVAEGKRYQTKQENISSGYFMCPLYKICVHVVWEGSNDQFRCYVDRVFETTIPEKETVYSGMAVEIENQGHVIYLRDFDKSPGDIAVLAHECFHVTEQIMGTKGVKFHEGQNNEAFAYLHEYLMRKCLELLYQKKKK